jgi:hypothetical protein
MNNLQSNRYLEPKIRLFERLEILTRILRYAQIDQEVLTVATQHCCTVKQDPEVSKRVLRGATKYK